MSRTHAEPLQRIVLRSLEPSTLTKTSLLLFRSAFNENQFGVALMDIPASSVPQVVPVQTRLCISVPEPQTNIACFEACMYSTAMSSSAAIAALFSSNNPFSQLVPFQTMP